MGLDEEDRARPHTTAASSTTTSRRPLHEPMPPIYVPPPISAHLDRANEAMRGRVGALATARQRREEVTRRAFVARTARLTQKIADSEATQRKQQRYVEALADWKHATEGERHARHRAAVTSSLSRHRTISSRGDELIAAKRVEFGVAPPSTPRKTATGARDERLLAPLEKTADQEELKARMHRKMFQFDVSKSRVLDSRAATAERKQVAREEREALAKQRAEEQERHARDTHIANTIRSELALQRAARRKARVRDPRRALAEDRLAAREAERERRMLEGTAERRRRGGGGAATCHAREDTNPEGRKEGSTRDGDEDDPFPERPAGHDEVASDDSGGPSPASSSSRQPSV